MGFWNGNANNWYPSEYSILYYLNLIYLSLLCASKNTVNRWWWKKTNVLWYYYVGLTADVHIDDEFGEKTVSVLLDGEESEMIFIDHASAEMSVSVELIIYYSFCKLPVTVAKTPKIWTVFIIIALCSVLGPFGTHIYLPNSSLAFQKVSLSVMTIQRKARKQLRRKTCCRTFHPP